VFYNARKSYSLGIQELEKSGPGKTSPNAEANFNLAIKKSYKLLDVYPNSKWCDDALLLIGKSYYFMTNYTDASKTFNELFANFPNSNLQAESHLYYAKTLLKENKYELAESEFLAITKSDAKDNIKSEAYFGLADLLFYREKYTEAIQQYDYRRSSEEFAKVEKLDPPNNIKYLASFGYGISFELMSEYDKAIDLFSEMLKNQKYFDYYGEILIEIARCYELKGDIDEAIKVLERLNSTDLSKSNPSQDISSLLIADVSNQNIGGANNSGNVQSKEKSETGSDELETTRSSSSFQQNTNPQNAQANAAQYKGNPEALYFIGELQLIKNFNFVEAKSIFEKALTASPTPELRNDINNRVKVINEISALHKNIGTKPPEMPVYADSTSVKDVSEKPATKEERIREKQREIEGEEKKTKEVKTNTATISIGDTLKMTEELKKYKEAKEKFTINRAKYFYRISELYLNQLDAPDSAFVYLDKIINDVKIDSFSAKALLFKHDIASAYEYDNAEQFKQELIDNYSDSKYALQFSDRQEIEEPTTAIEETIISTKIDTAKNIFLEAEKQYTANEDYDKSMELLNEIVERFPESDFAPKALLLSGWLYENKMGDNDKAIESFLKLTEGYKSSAYAKSLNVKMSKMDSVIALEKRLQNIKEKVQQALGKGTFTDSLGVTNPDSLTEKQVGLEDKEQQTKIINRPDPRTLRTRQSGADAAKRLRERLARQRIQASTSQKTDSLRTAKADSIKAAKADTIKTVRPDTTKIKKKEY
jgi:tetratricopeptide (TPR) repeat protein